MSKPFRGVYTIPSTPFDEKGQLDEEGLRRTLAWFRDSGLAKE